MFDRALDNYNDSCCLLFDFELDNRYPILASLPDLIWDIDRTHDEV